MKMRFTLFGAAFVVATVVNVVAQSPNDAARSKLNRIPNARYELGGVVREYVDAVTQNWLLTMPDRNRAILEMFADRDKQPPPNLLPWSGEFAGKYLTGAIQVHRLTQDAALKRQIAGFVSRLVKLQADDSYLGPFPPDNRLEGKGGTWDVWGHYHIMLGLLLWHEDTGNKEALICAERIGDLLCSKFLNTGKRIVDTDDPKASDANTDKNHAALHSLCLLYEVTGKPAYLDLARQIVDEFQDKRAGDYVRVALAGREFYQSPKPRWESLHAILGIAELYRITGDENYRLAFENLWWSIAKLDRHNNGGFSSGEQAQGNPYHPGAIETCCTVAWMAMSVEMLRLTGDSLVADELELSTLNQVLGYQHRSGKWCTYNTPMDGVRRNSLKAETAFQIRPGSEEINCCSANAPRGFGMISDWALMSDGRALVVNWYGSSTLIATLNGTAVTLKQRTEYPRADKILLDVSPERSSRFPLKLRIPSWSARTRVRVNGKSVSDVKPGGYLPLDREWKRGDTVQINLDMSLRYWVGERECAGKTSIYRGPLLLVRERPQTNSALNFSPQWKHYGPMSVAKESGAFIEFTFEGTGVIWKGHRYDDAGRAQLTIDGHEVAIVDQYGPGREIPFTWEHKGLQPGRHTLRLTILEQTNPVSKARWVNVNKLATLETAHMIFDAAKMDGKLVTTRGAAPPLLLIEFKTRDGKKVRLRDYATAGEGEVPYESWLNVQYVKATPFSKSNPLRSGRPSE
jgi:DUF1680 family protein